MLFAIHSDGSAYAKKKALKKRWLLLFSIFLLIAISVATVAYLTSSNTEDLINPQSISNTTTVFPTNHTVHVDHESATNIVVDISDNSISDTSYFTINTTSTGGEVPADAGSALSIQSGASIHYYDVKVATNSTLTPEIAVKISITNPAFNQNSIIYYWNSTQSKWIPIPTGFQASHTVVGSLPAVALTGTPIAVFTGNSPSPTPSPTPTLFPNPTPTTTPSPTPTASLDPTASPSPTPTVTPSPSPTPTSTPTPTDSPKPPFQAPEYTLGALSATLICLVSFIIFAVHRKKINNTR